MRDVVSSIELGKSPGPYRLNQEVAAPSQISPAAVAALCAALNAADFGDSTGPRVFGEPVPGVSGEPVPGVSGVPGPGPGPGVSGVAGVSGVPAAAHPNAHPKQVTPLRTLNCGTSTALEVALQVMVLCK